MAIRVAVPAEFADAVRSRIYAFLTARESRSEYQERDVFITVFPAGATSEYRFKFQDETEADDFVRYLPNLLQEIAFTCAELRD